MIDYAASRLATLCAACGFDGGSAEVISTFREMVSPWAYVPLGRPSPWASEISDDGTPIEFSVAIADGQPEVRVLFEPQGDAPTLPAFRAAGLALHERLEREGRANLDRFRKLQDLLLPEGMQGPFAVWSSAVFSPGKAASFKAYFNAQARGAEAAEDVVAEALGRLGFGRAWQELRAVALRRGPCLDELKYVALDLTPSADARVKVYVRHHGATPRDLETAACAAESYLEGDVLAFVRAMRGSDEAMGARAPFSCSAFTAACGERPAATTVYVPVCAYAHDDRAAQERVAQYMAGAGVDPARYVAITNGFANRPLESGVGMQSWVAFRRQRLSARLTVYLATESHRVHAPGDVPAPTRDVSDLLRPKRASQRPPREQQASHAARF